MLGVISAAIMKTHNLQIAVCDEDDAIIIPFDQEERRGLKYHCHIHSDKAEDKDRVVLSLNRECCNAFAQIFGQLALGPYQEGFHVHLGLDDSQACSRGIRIELKE